MITWYIRSGERRVSHVSLGGHGKPLSWKSFDSVADMWPDFMLG